MGDRRFLQGMSRRIARKAPDLDPRFVERRRTALLATEGPDHVRMRRIALRSAFTARSANRYRPVMQSIMHDIADHVPAGGVCDGAELVYEYPSRVIAHVLGIDADAVTSFSEVVDTIFAAQRGVADAVSHAWDALQQLDNHLLNLIEQKRLAPGDDLITDLLRAEAEDETLTASEIHIIATAVVLAGTETTRNTLTRGLQLLAEHPQIWAELIDDDSLLAAVEEILRFAPLAPIRRVTSEDLQVADRLLPKDEVLIVEFGAANRDPDVVSDPDSFRIDRPGPPPYLSLGHGHKYCLGANLAKAELVEALRVLRARHATLEIVEPPTWTYKGIPRSTSMMLRFGSEG
nr:mycinamicin IV hydroxylase/epoxidase-like [Nerophis lumbriciformis]